MGEKNKDFIDKLQKALDDIDIREKIKKIVTEDDKRERVLFGKNNTAEIRALQKRLEKEALHKELDKLQMEKEKLEKDNLSLQSLKLPNSYSKRILSS